MSCCERPRDGSSTSPVNDDTTPPCPHGSVPQCRPPPPILPLQADQLLVRWTQDSSAVASWNLVTALPFACRAQRKSRWHDACADYYSVSPVARQCKDPPETLSRDRSPCGSVRSPAKVGGARCAARAGDCVLVVACCCVVACGGGNPGRGGEVLGAGGRSRPVVSWPGVMWRSGEPNSGGHLMPFWPSRSHRCGSVANLGNPRFSVDGRRRWRSPARWTRPCGRLTFGGCRASSLT